jgi:GLPGLI family protein
MQAQMLEGRVIYEVSKIISGIEGVEPQNIKGQYELLFTSKASLYEQLPVATEGSENTTGVLIQTLGGSVTYTNLAERKRTEYKDVFGKEFLVTGDIKQRNWKLTDSSKIILKHKAFLAVSYRVDSSKRAYMENGELKYQYLVDTLRIEAWYAPELLVQAAPPGYEGQLPGLILEITEGKGGYRFKAIEISEKLNASRIKMPTRGKPVTTAEFKEEFNKLAEESLKNMPRTKTVQKY